jgi:hypothetical protein
MTPSIAITLIYSGGGPPVTGFEVEMFSLVVGAALLVGICWDVLDWWIKRTRGRSWPTVSAVIDVVSVTRVEGKGISSLGSHDWPYYRATLTYFYNSPERQTGDYSRRFGKKEDAEAWANSYKGETVKVHVDPRDPTRSMLREEDL